MQTPVANNPLSFWQGNYRLISVYVLLLFLFQIAIFSHDSGGIALYRDYGHYFFLGLAGALVANSTGAGGGVIFIPFFSAMGMTSVQSVATSMAIQCCGMTAGTISWLNSLTQTYRQDLAYIVLIKKLLVITGLSTIVGMLTGQYIVGAEGIEVARVFGVFSILFGLVLLVFTLRTRQSRWQHKSTINTWEITGIVCSCWIGGIITSWISVGVGEIIALVLFFMRFNASLAVAVGVYTSSVSVLTGVVFHTLYQPGVVLPVFLFAAQAALIGGYVAKYITQWLGGFYLKVFFAIWIIMTGIVMEL